MLSNIPTNIISGFLGVGKTTYIQRLLEAKPSDEKWAILVNEFGEVGIDGSIYKGQNDKKIYVREVPGGCMCCTAGLTMQVALNQLLAMAKPDRLIIEPTGLGHLDEVLNVLSEEHYTDVLTLNTVMTLVDARKLSDDRYLSNRTFQQQIELADAVVAAKSDLYQPDDSQKLVDYLQHVGDKSIMDVNAPMQAHFSQLAQATKFVAKTKHHSHSHDSLPPVLSAPEKGFISVDNQGEGFYSKGWIFNPEIIFDRDKTLSLFQTDLIVRMKGVFISYDGIFVVNKAEDAFNISEIDDALDSRFEIIGTYNSSWDSLEQALNACIAN